MRTFAEATAVEENALFSFEGLGELHSDDDEVEDGEKPRSDCFLPMRDESMAEVERQ